MPHEVVVGALVRDGRVLLVHRRADRAASPDCWDLPGGHVELGETAAAALARELREELDVQALRIGPAQLRIERAPDRDDGLRLEVLPVDSWHGEPRNAAEDEHDGMRWAGIDELPGLVLAHQAYGGLLTRLLAGSR